MPIPKPQIREIGARAATAVTIDNDLIESRNSDDSYGRQCKVDGKALITIATLQAFIEQGVPMDSDRLEGAYRWLLKNSSSCTSVEPSLLRANASISTGNINYEEQKADIYRLRELVRDLSINNYGTDHIPGFLLALECLENFNEIDSQIKPIVKDKLSTLLTSSLISPAELSYSIQIALDLNIASSDLITIALGNVLSQFDRRSKLWRGCYAETAYVVIDLSYVAQKYSIHRELQEAIITSIDELTKKYYKSDNPPIIKNIPSEIGTDINDRYIYLNALILRAIVRSSVFFSEEKTFSLKFAHAYLQKTYERLDNLLILLNKRTLVSKVGFPIASLAGIVLGGTIIFGSIKGWSTMHKMVSFVSACLSIGTWLVSFKKEKNK